jgi:large subunit ribosomal protein L37Ae
MTRTKKVGQAGSLGSRYGTVARRRYAEIVGNLRRPSECPRCHITAVRRESVGLWLCGKCGYKFAGGAYLAQTKLGEVARRATRARTQGAVSAPLGLIERKRETAGEEGTKPRRKRARRKKEADIQAQSETNQ